MIGFVGLGSIGSKIATRVATQLKTPIKIFDLNPSAVSSLSSDLLRPASSDDLITNSQIILTCLPKTHMVASTLSSSTHLSNKTIIDISSGDPFEAQSLATHLLATHSATFIDCPVSGGPTGAAAGALTAMVSGDESTYNDNSHIISTFAKKVYYVGPKVGSACAVKSVNNTLNMLNLLSASEGVSALAKFGVDPAIANEIIAHSSGSSLQNSVRITEKVLTRSFDYGFSLGLMNKDVTTGANFVSQTSTNTPLILNKNFAKIVDDITSTTPTAAAEDYTTAVVEIEKHIGGLIANTN